MLKINNRYLDVSKISYIEEVTRKSGSCFGFFIIIDGVRVDFSYASKDSVVILKDIIIKAVNGGE